MPRDLMHVTLTTGHRRLSPRSEVRDDVVLHLAPLVRRALDGESIPLPEPGYTMRGEDHGRCAIMTLYRSHTEGGPPELVPVLTIAIADHSRCGATTWRALHEGYEVVETDPEEQPPTPWLADRIEPGMARWPEAAHWTGDWSRCVAHTFLSSGEDG